MRKLRLTFLILFCAVSAAVFAGGRKDNESREVDNPAGFTESLDIENKKPGKWNFYLEAEDKGGNKSLAGPYNIYIDPASDLPGTRIINPRAGMRVQGNLNLVGTCTDDDAVDYVELAVTRGGDGTGEVVFQSRADGKEFWSYFLDTSDTEKWRDGVYTVTAWGVDVNGLSGISEEFPVKARKRHQVSWSLDRKKPEITVTSHELGALLNGKVTVRGTAWDGNGLDSLSYSLDGGVRYLPASLKHDTKADIYNFEFSVDTRVFEDGPAVIQLRARDRMRSEGALSFLILANNTGPDVEILYPNPEETMSGVFSVAGYATHKVGLSSLSYTLGKEKGEIPLIVGNPWWVKEFDIRGQKVKSLDLEIRAVDLSGNVTVAKRRILVDEAADQPKVTLNQPLPGEILSAKGMNVTGSAADNTGVEALFYSIDGQPPVEIPCTGYFQFAVEDIPGGVHNLEVWARDVTGLEGPKTTVKGIVAPGAAPLSRIVRAHSGSGKTAVTEDFRSGMELRGDLPLSFDLAVSSGSALQSIGCKIGSRDAAALSVRGSKGGEYSQSFSLPKDIERGLVRLEITVRDIHNRESVLEDYIYVSGEGAFVSEGFTWIRPNTGPGDGRILLSGADEILVGIANGKLLGSVELSGNGADSLNAWVDDYGRVNLSGTNDGSFGPVRFKLTGQDGVSFTTGEYRFLVDTGLPSLEMTESPDGAWVQNRVQVKFRASDANRITSADFSVDLGASWKTLLQNNEIDTLTSGSLIDRTLDISALQDGAINMIVRIVDEAGKQAAASFTVNKDTAAPEARLIVPVSGAKVNGTVRLGMAVKEAGKIVSVRYENPGSGEGEAAKPPVSRQIYPDPARGDLPSGFLDVVLDAAEMPLADNMSFTFADAAGNTSTLSGWPFVIDEEMDLPVAAISLPLENEVITSDFVISGICYDDDEVKQIYWSMDGGPEQVLETRHGFSAVIPLSSMTDNEHSVTVTAEDIYGVRSRSETRNFRVSLKEPMASVAIPSLGEIAGGTIRIAGIALDDNGIKRVQVSLDNGNSYNDAEGTTRWMYSFNSLILQDGPHVVFIRVWDNYDINAMYSSMLIVDNTAPELVVDTPRDGITTTGPVYVTGRAVDSLMLESLSIYVSSLDGKEIPPELASKEVKLDPLVLEELDLGSLPDGTYNVEVWATDKAKNTSRLSRNIQLAKDNQRNFVDNLYPLNGEYVQGNFNLYGYVGGIDKAGEVTLLVNDRTVAAEPVSEAGYYRFAVNTDYLVPGANKIVVSSDFGGRESVDSAARTINYRPDGPWVTVDTMNMGDFAYERPWLMGRAGYALSAEDEAILADKKADKEARAAVEAKKAARVELSFDNGSTFFDAGKAKEDGYDWRYRIETGDMTEGLHYLVVRALMENGESAVTRLLIQVDKTAPVIRLISPESGGRYNDSLEFTALASDDVELKSLGYYLRKGDRAAYEVPGFIKGLYLESTIPPFVRQIWNDAPLVFAGGTTYMDLGLGLSFFDDNVKLQAQYGFMTQSLYESLGGLGKLRYGGHVLGIKLLANVYTLPFGSFGGPDWEWLSASFALGANFSLFDLAEEGYTQSGNATWLSAMLAQIEFPKVTIPGRTFLRTFSFFTEGQLWFVPTDVNAEANKVRTIQPKVILGLRMYIF